MESNTIKCPKCSSTQLLFNKKGFSGKKAVVGAVLTGGIGLLAGTIGSNKVVASCLACGNTFSPTQQKIINNTAPMRNTKIAPVRDKPLTPKQYKIKMFAYLFITLILSFFLIKNLFLNENYFLIILLLLGGLITGTISHFCYRLSKEID